MNDLEKLVQLKSEQHERGKGAAKFFWWIFLMDKALGALVIFLIIAALIYLFLHH